MAQASHKPTERSRQRVYDLSSFGRTQDEICQDLEITKKTLAKYYATELKLAGNDLIVLAGNCLRQKVVDGDLTAAMFTLKTRARFRETDPKQQNNSVHFHEDFVKILEKQENK